MLDAIKRLRKDLAEWSPDDAGGVVGRHLDTIDALLDKMDEMRGALESITEDVDEDDLELEAASYVRQYRRQARAVLEKLG